MAYITTLREPDRYSTTSYSTRKVVIIEVYSEGMSIRKALKDAGYTFYEEDFLNHRFWGKRFVIDKPIGKGASKRLNFLMAL